MVCFNTDIFREKRGKIFTLINYLIIELINIILENIVRESLSRTNATVRNTLYPTPGSVYSYSNQREEPESVIFRLKP